MDRKYMLKSEGMLIRDRGAWCTGEDYDAGDLVQNNGSFICIAGHVSTSDTEPPTGANWITVWKALQVVSATNESQYFKALSNNPYLRLVESGGKDVLIRLTGGVLQFYDNNNGVLRSSIDMSTGKWEPALDLNGPLYVAAEKTDNQIGCPISAGASTIAGTGAAGGTWTVAEPAVDNVQKATRTAAAADHHYRIPIPLPIRGATGKGAKLKSVTVSYTLGGTIDTSNDAIQIMILKQTIRSNGSAPIAVVLAGDSDVDYDVANNTDAKRLAAGEHTVTVSIPTVEQAYAALNETFAVRIRVKDAATANLAFALTGCVANYASAEY